MLKSVNYARRIFSMKNKMMRLIATILILASMVSMFAIFAAAETSTEGSEEEEEYIPELQVLYNRTFDEGWDHKNGADEGNVPGGGKPFTFDYEYNADYTYNYFLRFSVISNNNTFLQYNFGNNDKYGSVFEFDIKTDDWTNISNFLHFGTVGSSSSTRNNYQVMSIVNNQVYFAKPANPGDATASFDATPTFQLSDSWNHVAIVFDYTYDHDGNPETDELEYFQYSIYYGDTETYHKTGELTLYGTFVGRGKDNSGKGINLFRFNHTMEQYTYNPDTSVCLDNVQCYNYEKEYGKVSPESTDKGIKIKLDYPKTIDIESGGGTANKTKGDYLNECYALKLGVDYAYAGNGFYKLADKDTERKTLRTPILGEDGSAYGAPFIDDDGVIWVALEPILEYCGYPIYLHKDGIYADISTGKSSSFISTQSSVATVDGKSVELRSIPRYYYPDGDESKKYLAMNIYDIETILPEYYVDYDELGLIVISQSDDPYILDRDNDLSSMMDLMKCFIFDYATGEEIYNDVKENTNNFTHPYLHTNQETFDKLRAIFYAEEGDENYDPEMRNYILKLIWSGYEALGLYAKLDEDGNYLGLMSMDEQIEWLQIPRSVQITNITDIPELSYSGKGNSASQALSNYIENFGLIQPYYSSILGGEGQGYDLAGGRSNVGGRTANLEEMAFAYQITRDERLLYAAYDMAIALGEWQHWGPGHFLNCADGAAPFATYLDWTYNFYVELYESGQTKYDVRNLERILYVKGVLEGVVSTHNVATEFTSPPVGTGGSYYTNRDNNWHAVCTAGMASAALAIMGSDLTYDYSLTRNGTTLTVNGSIAEWGAWMISQNIQSLTAKGMQQYAPEGAYIESPGYWDYGTNNFFEFCSVLKSAAGTEYGLMDCWGIDRTCYFATHTESSDFCTFNYHDGSMGTQSTYYFFFVGQHFGDDNLIKVRLAHLANGKSITMYDLFYYPEGELSAGEMEYDYFCKQLDLYTARSSWDKGALYVGMMGGINQLGHGQIDAGSFVYHNAGTVWFVDLGTENYNSAGFWPADTRYRYYVMKPEGNNTITLVSDPFGLPYGQELTATAPMVDWGSNEHGSYAVLDMTTTLKGNATSWMRGMMVTNDRKTTVIQDEIFFEGVQEAWWFAHFDTDYLLGNSVDAVKLSQDARTAYLYDKWGHVLRVKIESARSDLKFQIMDTYTFVHTKGDKPTFGPEYSASTPNQAGQIVPEHDRNKQGYYKLGIHIPSTPSVSFAVIIELIDKDTAQTSNEKDKGYNFTNLKSWEPYADTRSEIPEEVLETIRKAPVLTNIRKNVQTIDNFYDMERAYNVKLKDFYRALCDTYYIIINFYPSELVKYEEYIAKYETYKADYDAFIGTINNTATATRNLSLYMLSV